MFFSVCYQGSILLRNDQPWIGMKAEGEGFNEITVERQLGNSKNLRCLFAVPELDSPKIPIKI
jgi:hypothetical protein